MLLDIAPMAIIRYNLSIRWPREREGDGKRPVPFPELASALTMRGHEGIYGTTRRRQVWEATQS